MKDAQKPNHISLGPLIKKLREGSFVIPDFQREFEWQPWDIRDLMRSIFLDYFIGSLLLWKGKTETFGALACEPVYGFSSNSEDPRHIVLDGQQRLTAIYYTFVAPDLHLPNRRNRYYYYVHVDRFMSEDYDEAFSYGWTRGTARLMKDRQQQFREHIFPLWIFGAEGWDLPNWVQEYEAYWSKEAKDANASGDLDLATRAQLRAKDAKQFGIYLHDLQQQYQVSYIELDQDLELSKVCDIFTQVNSKGVRLDVFDLMNAMLKPKGLQLKHMWRAAKERLDFVETGRMNVYVLQVMSILRQQYCSPHYLYYLLPGHKKKVREPDGTLKTIILVSDVDEFSQLWDTAVESIESSLKLLQHPQEFGATLSRYLPYVSIVPAFSALQTAASQNDPYRHLDAQKKIRLWYWASVFTRRYSGAVESTAARDYGDLCQWFESDEAEPALISEFTRDFRELELHRETRRGTSIYNGLFNLLVIRGAKDWITGAVPQHGVLDDHHIVPQRWGRTEGLGVKIDSILNRTPLTANTNRHVIGDRLPNEYLPELIQNNGEETVRATLASHFITETALEILLRTPFGISDFEDFTLERQRTFYNAIEELLITEPN